MSAITTFPFIIESTLDFRKQPDKYEIVLHGPSKYLISILPQEPNMDFDVEIYDENNNLIAQDNSPDSIAETSIAPKWTGPFNIVVNTQRGISKYYLVLQQFPDTSNVQEENSSNLSFDDRWLVHIGIGDYRKAGRTSLLTPAQDVQAITEMFLSDQSYQQADEKKAVLIDETATREAILTALSNYSKLAKENDLFIFYFSGHGKIVDGQAILLPYDYDRRASLDSAVKLNDVKTLISSSGARAKIMIIDACHSGPDLQSKGDEMDPDFYEAVFERTTGMAVFSSCLSNQMSYSYLDTGLSAFTYFLCQGLMGNADRMGQGFVTLFDLFTYVAGQMASWSRERQLEQTPGLDLKTTGDIILVHPKHEQN